MCEKCLCDKGCSILVGVNCLFGKLNASQGKKVTKASNTIDTNMVDLNPILKIMCKMKNSKVIMCTLKKI